MKWMLKEYLTRHDLTAYQLAKATGLSVNTIYPLARGEAQRVSLETLQTVLGALDELTGERVSLTDVLEREAPDDQPKKSWLDLAGTFDDPDSPGDVAINHDKYLGEALMEEHLEGLAGKR